MKVAKRAKQDITTTININKTVLSMGEKLAREDKRDLTAELEWLINAEYSRRFLTEPIRFRIPESHHKRLKQIAKARNSTWDLVVNEAVSFGVALMEADRARKESL